MNNRHIRDVRIYKRALSQEEIDDMIADPYALYKPITRPRYWPIRSFWKRLIYRIMSKLGVVE